jgi:hypothetical protein
MTLTFQVEVAWRLKHDSRARSEYIVLRAIDQMKADNEADEDNARFFMLFEKRHF